MDSLYSLFFTKFIEKVLEKSVDNKEMRIGQREISNCDIVTSKTPSNLMESSRGGMVLQNCHIIGAGNMPPTPTLA
jgi:hypothetical protein